MTQPTLPATAPTAARRVPSRFGTEYRTDIQGMRAIAVVLVLLFHSGLPMFSGGFVGVDVFFVISGYLITGIVSREIDETGRLSLARFYSRRALRILPAATVVLVAVAIGAVLWLPVTRWRSTAAEIIGSALYASNWQFAATTDYLNSTQPPSALQHFWSLAVEEQYYLLWPALLVAGIVYLRYRNRRAPAPGSSPHRFALFLMLAISVVSFIVSIIAVERWPGPAYFVTPTRLWELGIGSILALLVPRLRGLSLPLSRALAIGGLAMVLCAGVLYDEATAFPGASALLPVIGTALLIAGGVSTASKTRRHLILGNPGMVWIGNISYALYLWHWPILIIARQGFGVTGVGPSLLLVAASAIPAYLSTRYIEQPIARNRRFRAAPRFGFRIGLAAIVCSLIAAAAVFGLLRLNVQPAQPFNAATMGAAALTADASPPPLSAVPTDLTPSLVDAKDDNPQLKDLGCHLEVAETTPNEECAFGDTSGPTVLLTGDSHAAQWSTAWRALANEHDFRLVVMTKSSCPLVDTTVELTGKDRPYTECAEWNANIRAYIEREHPVAVVTSSLGLYLDADRPSDPAALQQGMHRAWEWVNSRGIPVFPIVDSPYMNSNVPECLAKSLRSPEECGTPREAAFPFADLERDAARGLSDVTLIDVNDKICPGATCEPIIGDVLVYRDPHHLTATYVRSLVPALDDQAAGLWALLAERDHT